MNKDPFPKVIVITGLPGAGKSHVAQYFKNLGAFNLDADRFARQALDNDQALQDALPADCRESNGTINRSRLREYFLRDAVIRKQLEDAIHPQVMRLYLEAIGTYDAKKIVTYELPLLFEKNLSHPSFQKKVCVVAPLETIQTRLLARGLTNSNIDALLSLHLSQEEKAARSDAVIDSSQVQEKILDSVQTLFNAIA